VQSSILGFDLRKHAPEIVLLHKVIPPNQTSGMNKNSRKMRFKIPQRAENQAER
jgi:hypothetical protein